MNSHKSLSDGFTIIEMAIVILLGGVLMAMATTMLLNYLKESSMLTTRNRMQDIDNALIQYINVNGVLPCVASLTDLESGAAFGRSIHTSPGTDCYAAAGAGGTYKTTGEIPGATPPDTRTATTNTTGFIATGAVPVRDLGLPDDDVADAWGDRFVYAVTDALTVTGGYDPTQGSISVVDSTSTSITRPSGSALYVIISLGTDRAGAYTIAGAPSAVACPAGAIETPNCTYTTNKFVKTLVNSSQTGAANMYDDYVTYHTQINSTGTAPSGLATQFVVPPWTAPTTPTSATCSGPGGINCCPPGWSFYPSPPGTACNASAAIPPDYVCCKKN